MKFFYRRLSSLNKLHVVLGFLKKKLGLLKKNFNLIVSVLFSNTDLRHYGSLAYWSFLHKSLDQCAIPWEASCEWHRECVGGLTEQTL